ncbi:hypothetical protein [Meridianimarinicoccus sp. MJW13]|uniref:hypothetical protein n=1 Tax=Meridianimarinicoccus sp. MJW13 TaxID=2720031 RepID=UPI0018695957|nr:hypothetical protein [Fluviibacterium sp. MJW13]
MTRFALFLPVFFAAAPALADLPQVVEARATATGQTWRIDVTLRHPDTGWDHYADGWEVVTPDGQVLGYRELLHPHVQEQPFTRSLTGVAIPADLSDVRIRARCQTDGWGPAEFTLTLPR